MKGRDNMFTKVNGMALYYESFGQGKPVILIHGNGEDHTAMMSLASSLVANHTIYLPDSRDHGQSTKVDHLSYDDMADDIAAFIQNLNLEKPLIIGSSDGAIIGLLVAIKHPGLCSGIISAGANRFPSELKAWLRIMARVRLWSTRGDPKLALMLNEPNLTDELLSKITEPVLVMAGQRDVISENSTRALAAAIPNAALCILKGETHSSYINHGERLIAAAQTFIDGL